MAPKNASHLPLVLDGTSANILRAEAYLHLDRAADALVLAGEALDQIRRSSVRDYYQILEADAALRLGQAQQRAGDPKSARLNLERAVKLREANDDAKSPWLAEAEVALADCLIDLGERKEAHALIDQAKAIHTAQAELGEHFKVPLRRVAARLAA